MLNHKHSINKTRDIQQCVGKAIGFTHVFSKAVNSALQFVVHVRRLLAVCGSRLRTLTAVHALDLYGKREPQTAKLNLLLC